MSVTLADDTKQSRVEHSKAWQDPDLRYFGVQALTHLDPSMRDQHSAVSVDVHQRCSLVQELGGEGDAKLGGDDSQATLAPPVGLVELICCLLPLRKICLLDGSIPTSRHEARRFEFPSRSLHWYSAHVHSSLVP